MTIDIECLVRTLGPDGTRAGLRASKTITVEELRSSAAGRAGALLTKSSTRSEVVDAVLAPFENRLTKSVEELKAQPEKAIAEYLKMSGCSLVELALWLERSKIPYRRGLTRPQLITDAARQISGLGLYAHIAGGVKLVDDSAQQAPHDDVARGLDGDWFDEFGGRATLRILGDAIEGSYSIKSNGRATESEITGRAGRACDSFQILVFYVIWGDNAATTWIGRLIALDQEQAISAFWILADQDCGSERTCTTVGRALLTRRTPGGEEEQRTRKLFDPPWPRKHEKAAKRSQK